MILLEINHEIQIRAVQDPALDQRLIVPKLMAVESEELHAHG
jgi:hypothetical protein